MFQLSQSINLLGEEGGEECRVSCYKKFGADRFNRFDIFWILTEKQTNKASKFRGVRGGAGNPALLPTIAPLTHPLSVSALRGGGLF